MKTLVKLFNFDTDAEKWIPESIYALSLNPKPISLIFKDRTTHAVKKNICIEGNTSIGKMEKTLINIKVEDEIEVALSFLTEIERDRIFTILFSKMGKGIKIKPPEVTAKWLTKTTLMEYSYQSPSYLVTYLFEQFNLLTNGFTAKLRTLEQKPEVKEKLKTLIEFSGSFFLKTDSDYFELLFTDENGEKAIKMLDFVFGTDFFGALKQQLTQIPILEILGQDFKQSLFEKTFFVALKKLICKKQKNMQRRNEISTKISLKNFSLLKSVFKKNIESRTFLLKKKLLEFLFKNCFSALFNYFAFFNSVATLFSSLKVWEQETIKENFYSFFDPEFHFELLTFFLQYAMADKSGLHSAILPEIILNVLIFLKTLVACFSSDLISGFLRGFKLKGLKTLKQLFPQPKKIFVLGEKLFVPKEGHKEDTMEAKCGVNFECKDDVFQLTISALFGKNIFESYPIGKQESLYYYFLEVFCALLKSNYPLVFNQFLGSKEKNSIKDSSFKFIFFRIYFQQLFQMCYCDSFTKNLQFRTKIEILNLCICLFPEKFFINTENKSKKTKTTYFELGKIDLIQKLSLISPSFLLNPVDIVKVAELVKNIKSLVLEYKEPDKMLITQLKVVTIFFKSNKNFYLTNDVNSLNFFDQEIDNIKTLIKSKEKTFN